MNQVNSVLSVICSLCLLIGTPLNLLALLHFINTSTKTLSNKIFTAVSLIDSILCFSMLHCLVVLLQELPEEAAVSSTVCQIQGWVWNIFSRFSIFLSSILSVMRVVSVYSPFSNLPDRTIIMVVILQFIYLVLFESSPYFLSDRIVTFKLGVCDWTVSYEKRGVYHMFFSLAYYIPIILTVSSSLISYCLLRKNKNKFTELEGEEAVTYQNQRYASNTIFILVVIYVLCNTPYVLILLLCDLDVMTGARVTRVLLSWGHFEVQSFGSVYLVAVNAAATPVVFLLRLKKFRENVKTWFGVIKKILLEKITWLCRQKTKI